MLELPDWDGDHPLFLLLALDDWAAATPDERRRAWCLGVARLADAHLRAGQQDQALQRLEAVLLDPAHLLLVELARLGRGAEGAVRHVAAGTAGDLGNFRGDQGARRMTILADPNAVSFYERMGARFVRNAPSDAIPGRLLPLYEYDLTSGVDP